MEADHWHIIDRPELEPVDQLLELELLSALTLGRPLRACFIWNQCWAAIPAKSVPIVCA